MACLVIKTGIIRAQLYAPDTTHWRNQPHKCLGQSSYPGYISSGVFHLHDASIRIRLNRKIHVIQQAQRKGQSSHVHRSTRYYLWWRERERAECTYYLQYIVRYKLTSAATPKGCGRSSRKNGVACNRGKSPIDLLRGGASGELHRNLKGFRQKRLAPWHCSRSCYLSDFPIGVVPWTV